MSSSQEFIWGKVPVEWKIDKLVNVADYISRGKQPKYVEKSNVKVLNQKAVRWHFIDSSYLKYHNPEVKVDEKHFIKKDDVVLNSTGTGTLGRIYHFKDDPINMFADSHITIIRTKKDILDPRFLMYQVSEKKYQDFIEGAYISGSTGQVEFNKSKVQELLVLLPPIEEQRQIVSILTSLDEKIELNNQINKNLEEMAQAIFKSWFVDFEPFQDGEFVESELGLIPKGWRIGNLEELICISSGKRPKKKNTSRSESFNIPLIGASSIMGYVKEHLFNEPILVIGRVGTHGIVQRINGKSWPSDNTLVIKTNYYEFIYQILKTIDYKSINRGSTQPLITQTDIKSTKIVIPDKEVLDSYEQTVGTLFKLFEKNLQENVVLTNLRDTLLPKLMSGEICVPLENEGRHQDEQLQRV